MNRIILITYLVGAFWYLRRDIRLREGVSAAIWIPMIWFGIISSKQVSGWLGAGQATSYNEGSPLDRIIMLSLIGGAIFTLMRRHFPWKEAIKSNWPIFFYYGYFFVSILWADATFPAFKRIFKDFGNVLMVFLVLSEVNPSQAVRAIFCRCAYFWIPLSFIFLRYFPALGRRYNIHSGQMETVGVTDQKNSIGVMILTCGLILFWDFIIKKKQGEFEKDKIDLWVKIGLLLLGSNLLYLSDSKTSMLALCVGIAILSTQLVPYFEGKMKTVSTLTFASIIFFVLAEYLFGIAEIIVTSMGRDMTFTGRTNVWNAILTLPIDPVFGTGFYSFWSDPFFQGQLPEWVAFSAHNGYVETYIDGGWIGVACLVIMLLTSIVKITRQLSDERLFATVRFGVLLVTLIANFSESHFARMSDIWFLFLLCAIDLPNLRKKEQAELHIQKPV